MIASFTKWDNSLSGTLGAGPIGVPLSEVLLYFAFTCHLSVTMNREYKEQL